MNEELIELVDTKWSIQDQVIADIEERKQTGLDNYGTLLYPSTTGDMLQHMYEEILDAACYLKTLMARRESLEIALAAYNKYPGKGDISDWVANEAEQFLKGINNEST